MLFTLALVCALYVISEIHGLQRETDAISKSQKQSRSQDVSLTSKGISPELKDASKASAVTAKIIPMPPPPASPATRINDAEDTSDSNPTSSSSESEDNEDNGMEGGDVAEGSVKPGDIKSGIDDDQLDHTYPVL